MGAWGALAFDNDTAHDWAYDLDEVNDLSVVEAALGELEDASVDYLDQDTACIAIAACEVLARLRGNFGYRNAFTENVDNWVQAHPIKPDAALVKRGREAIARVMGDASELRELWAEGDYDSWQKAVEDLLHRLSS
jgi:hypothetical protein